MSQNCSRCRAPLETGFVDVRYLGAERRLSVRLRNVPTPMCPSCHHAVPAEAWERLLHLGPRHGWQMQVEPVHTDDKAA